MYLASSIAMGLAFAAPSDPIAAEFERLKTVQLSRHGPSAVVLIDRETDGLTALVAYRVTSADPEAASYWIIRKTTHAGQQAPAEIADSRNCSAVTPSLLELERMPLPRLEILARGAEIQSPPPRMGALHRRSFMWVRGWTANNEPIGVSLDGLGASPALEWTAKVEAALADCWNREGANPT